MADKPRIGKRDLQGRLTIRMPKDLIEQLERHARSNDRSLGAETRLALRAHLEQKDS